MNEAEFETALRQAGYLDVERKQVPPDHSTEPHSHPFDVRTLVLAGEVTLTSKGESRTYRAGSVFAGS
jgi:quercetin dioxygenase-like cupin family protein